MFRLGLRALRVPLGAGAAAAACASIGGSSECKSSRPEPTRERFQSMPPESTEQLFRPSVPYPQWDSNWDYCRPTEDEMAAALGLKEKPSKDWAHAIHHLIVVIRPASAEAHSSRAPGHKTPAQARTRTFCKRGYVTNSANLCE